MLFIKIYYVSSSIIYCHYFYFGVCCYIYIYIVVSNNNNNNIIIRMIKYNVLLLCCYYYFFSQVGVHASEHSRSSRVSNVAVPTQAYPRTKLQNEQIPPHIYERDPVSDSRA